MPLAPLLGPRCRPAALSRRPLLPIAAFIARVATRERIAPAGVRLVIIGNVLWVLASLALLFAVSPTPLGYVFVIAQALVVADASPNRIRRPAQSFLTSALPRTTMRAHLLTKDAIRDMILDGAAEGDELRIAHLRPVARTLRERSGLFVFPARQRRRMRRQEEKLYETRYAPTGSMHGASWTEEVSSDRFAGSLPAPGAPQGPRVFVF